MGENIWRCTILPEHINGFKRMSQFWKDVLCSWNEFNFNYNFRVENQLIWYNSYITVNRKPIMWNDVFSKGLLYVHQLFHDQEYKSSILVWEQYGLSELRYNSIKMSIPAGWKMYFQSFSKIQFFPLPPHNYDTCLYDGSNLSAKVYQYLAEDATLLVQKYKRWQQEVGENFCENIYQFGQKHLDIYRLSNVAKYRSFQYRLLQRGIVTNIHLYSWKITQSDLCYYCQNERETVCHLFYQCPIILNLWKDVVIYVKNRFMGIKVELNLQNVILNSIIIKKSHVGNFLCLLTKQFIYRQKCMKLPLHFELLRKEIDRVENIEKYIAIKNKKLAVHNRKWQVNSQSGSFNNDNLEQYISEYNFNIQM